MTPIAPLLNSAPNIMPSTSATVSFLRNRQNWALGDEGLQHPDDEDDVVADEVLGKAGDMRTEVAENAGTGLVVP